jgi:hypothetical protein
MKLVRIARHPAADGPTRYGVGILQVGAAINGDERTITNLFPEHESNTPVAPRLTPRTSWRDLDGDEIGDACELSRGDIDLDGIVPANDLGILLGE